MKRAILVLFAILLVVGLVKADVDTKDGVAITTTSNIDGFTSNIDDYDGQVVTSGVTDYTADANCMGAWFMNGTGDETDRSGEGGTLVETGGTIELIPDECAGVDNPHGDCTGSGEASGHIPSGYSGKSRYFDLSDTVGLEHGDGNSTDISGTTPISIVAWIKCESQADNMVVVAKYAATDYERQYQIMYRTAEDTVCGYLGYGQSGYCKECLQTTMDLDTWYHVAMTWDGSTINMYLNGSDNDDGSTSCSESVNDSTRDFVIGAYGDQSGGFDGLIDEVAIFNKELSAAEVSDIYTNGLDGTKGGND